MKHVTTLVLLLALLGCRPEPQEPTLENRLLLKPQQFKLPEMTRPGVTQLVSFIVLRGENQMILSPTNIRVASGYVRFRGKDGFVEFRTNTHTVLWTKTIDTNLLSQALPTVDSWPELRVHASKPPFVVSVNWAGRSPSLNEIGYRYKDLCFELEATHRDKGWRVNFTMETSQNFVGHFGGWTLMSNWK